MKEGIICCKNLKTRIKNNGWRIKYVTCNGKWVVRQNNHNVFNYCPFCGKKITGVEIESDKEEN